VFVFEEVEGVVEVEDINAASVEVDGDVLGVAFPFVTLGVDLDDLGVGAGEGILREDGDGGRAVEKGENAGEAGGGVDGLEGVGVVGEDAFDDVPLAVVEVDFLEAEDVFAVHEVIAEGGEV